MNAPLTHAMLDISADVRRPEPVKPIGRYAPIPSAGPTWTLDDERESLKQGWFVHWVDGRICAATGGPAMRLHFSSDKAAQAFVGFRASLGDELAARAFAYLADRLGLTQTAMEYGRG